MIEPREDESSWDSLADDLGLPPATKEVARTVAQHKELSAPEEPIESPPPKVSVVEVVVPPAAETEVMFESPGHVTVSVAFHSEVNETEEGEGEVIEVTDFSTRSANASEEEGDDEEAVGDAPRGKKRRRRRRRGRRGAEGAETTETLEVPSVEVEAEAEEEATPPHEEVELEDAPELDDDDDAEVEPMSAIDEEMEAEVAAPKQEWNVVSWVDLVASLHRPER